MTGRVLVRQKMLSGSNKLEPGEIISDKDGVLRVKLDSQRQVLNANGTPIDKLIEVKASDVIQAKKVFGSNAIGHVLPKSYPTSIGALGNILNK